MSKCHPDWASVDRWNRFRIKEHIFSIHARITKKSGMNLEYIKINIPLQAPFVYKHTQKTNTQA